MNDGLGFEQQEPPIEIDARSPGERWVQSGRVEFERFRVVLEGARLDALALAWMVLVIVFTGVQIYQALRLGTLGLFPGSARDWWTKLGFLSQSGGVLLIFGLIAAIGMAAFFDTPVARMTLRCVVRSGPRRDQDRSGAHRRVDRRPRPRDGADRVAHERATVGEGPKRRAGARRAQLRPVIAALTSHNRSAAAVSSAEFEGFATLHW